MNTRSYEYVYQNNACTQFATIISHMTRQQYIIIDAYYSGKIVKWDEFLSNSLTVDMIASMSGDTPILVSVLALRHINVKF